MANSNIKIYQNYISDDDIRELDPAFIPQNWKHNPYPQYRETFIFLNMLQTGVYREADYVGAVSKNFFRKTKISGKQFIEFIRANPGYDVYFINPFPQNAYFTYNVWQHGEHFHPGIIQATQALFDYADISIYINELGRNNRKTLLYCNYWVGNTVFWETYVAFLKKLFLCVTDLMPSEVRAIYFSGTPHNGGTCCLFPFIFERLFSTYLLMKTEIKYLAYSHTPDEIYHACINEREIKLYSTFSDIVDKWDDEGMNEQVMREAFSGLARFRIHFE